MRACPCVQDFRRTRRVRPLDQAVPGATRDYVVVSGDNFTTIGQKLVVPPPTAPSVAMATVGNGSENAYLVKSGDTLLKIAQANHSTVKEIKALNGLTTDRIKVGDKLKLPAKSACVTSLFVTAADRHSSGEPVRSVLPGESQPPRRGSIFHWCLSSAE